MGHPLEETEIVGLPNMGVSDLLFFSILTVDVTLTKPQNHKYCGNYLQMHSYTHNDDKDGKVLKGLRIQLIDATHTLNRSAGVS